MIRRKDNYNQSILHDMFGGKGDFIQKHILEKEEFNNKGRLFAVCSLPVGGCVGEHTHHGDLEVCYFLSGRGKVIDDGVETQVYPGDTNITLDGHSHKIENIGDGELTYIALILYNNIEN